MRMAAFGQERSAMADFRATALANTSQLTWLTGTQRKSGVYRPAATAVTLV